MARAELGYLGRIIERLEARERPAAAGSGLRPAPVASFRSGLA